MRGREVFQHRDWEDTEAWVIRFGFMVSSVGSLCPPELCAECGAGKFSSTEIGRTQRRGSFDLVSWFHRLVLCVLQNSALNAEQGSFPAQRWREHRGVGHSIWFHGFIGWFSVSSRTLR